MTPQQQFHKLFYKQFLLRMEDVSSSVLRDFNIRERNEVVHKAAFHSRRIKYHINTICHCIIKYEP